MRLWIDSETRSPIPIKRGHAAYAQGVEVIMVQWAVDDGPITIEDLIAQDFQPSLEFEEAFTTADEVWAHEASFDRRMLKASLGLEIDLKRWRCTAALARMHGLPGKLAKLCDIFKLPQDEAKDKRGRELIQIFCIPYTDKKGDTHYHGPRERPREWQEFLAYGGQDVVSMRAVWRQCPKWNASPRMWAAWRADELQNERGIAVDLLLSDQCVKATKRVKRELGDRTEEITFGEVERTTQRDRLLAYLADYGVKLPDLKADTVARRLEDESLPDHVKELLRIRQQASKASTAKYQRVLTHAVNGRLHDLIVFCGAQRTGRKAARTFQPQNLPRIPSLPDGSAKYTREQIAVFIDAFREDWADLIDPADIFGMASVCLRGVLIAAEGKKLAAADLANIEGRVMAWVAGEEWKIAAFQAYDRKEGPDLYKVAYAKPFKINPADITDEGDQRRQIGKVMELALQYYGGVGAFCAMAETYGLKLEKLADSAWAVLPKWARIAASVGYELACTHRRTYGLDRKVWIVCHALVLMWRKEHPAIVRFWHALENAVVSAIHHPDRGVDVGRVRVDRRGNWLRIRLPSGRYLSYPAPRFSEETGVNFVGVDPYTHQWKRIATYSGKLAENIVQATAADILIDGQIAAEAAGYAPVLTVHDELICEVPDDEDHGPKELSRLMVSSSPWAQGLPMTAKGFETHRYRK